MVLGCLPCLILHVVITSLVDGFGDGVEQFGLGTVINRIVFPKTRVYPEP